VVRVPGYRSRGPGLIPGATREVVGLERGPLSLVSTSGVLLERKSSGSGLENREYGYRDPTRHADNLALTLPTSSGRSDGIVRSRTKATELLISIN
jgi:hypothetical protein